MPKKPNLDELIALAASKKDSVERGRIAAAARKLVKPKPSKRIGAPSHYSEKVAATICKEVSNGMTLTKTCDSIGITPKSVYDWLEKNPDFSKAYQQARESMARSLVDQLIDEAKETEPDRAMLLKVKASIFQWAAGRFNPREYGDNRRIELKGEIQHTHNHELSEEQRRRIAESWIISRESETLLIEATTSGPDREPGVSVSEPEQQRELPRRKAAAIKPKAAIEADGW